MGALKLTYYHRQRDLEVNLLFLVKGLEKNALREKNRVSSSTYGFNGKEKDDEVSGSGNVYDYGFRIYGSRLGRFLSVDPIFKGYPWWTPYQYASNIPIAAKDLDGLEADISIYGHGEGKGESAFIKQEATSLQQNIKGIQLQVSPAYSGKAFLDALKGATKAEGTVRSLIIFSHAWQQGISFDFSLHGNNAFSSLIPPKVGGGPGENFASFNDLIKAVESKEIVFDKNAIIILGGCNCASEEDLIGKSGSIASRFAKEFDVKVIASKGKFTSKDGKTGTTVFTSVGGFYSYEKDDKGNVVENFLGYELDFAEYLEQFQEDKKETDTQTKPDIIQIPPYIILESDNTQVNNNKKPPTDVEVPTSPDGE